MHQPDCDGYACESDDVRGLESGARENRICLLLGVSECGHPHCMSVVISLSICGYQAARQLVRGVERVVWI